MRNQPFTLLLHIALVIILAGAFVTHFFGIQGSVTLHTGEASVSRFEKESGPGDGGLPFELSLEKVEIAYYPATTTPMDFKSILRADGETLTVAMNKVGEFRGWRFYQSGMSGDSTALSVSHDPWGIGITYVGYILLGIGMAGFFFQPNTLWRALLRKYRKGVAVMVMGFAALPGFASEQPLPAMQRPLAANLGKVLVYWNDRICPMQTMASDVTSKLYGSESYEGLTADQVLSGWIFYYDRWKRDYIDKHPELRTIPPYPTSKKEKKAAERLALINWMGTGEAFKIYPYKTIEGRMEWLSLTARKPSGMNLEQWKFMQTTMPEIKDLLRQGKNVKANEVITALKEGQRNYGGPELPTARKIEAERLYNCAVKPLWMAIASMLLGVTILWLSIVRPKSSCRFQIAGSIGSRVLVIYLGVSLGLLWHVGGHVPLSNGPETMMFMAFAALVGTVIVRDELLRGGLLIVAAMALFVAVMSGRTPQIGAMMPVLASPLLSVHVMVVMIAYSIFLLTTIFAAIALWSKNKELKGKLSVLNRLLLPPAVCLLGAGIFIGAVWANQTWGRYWGWDPKETCALVMWLVYALPLHWGMKPIRIKIGKHDYTIIGNRFSPAVFRKDKVLNIYLLLAILTVIFTYFGANYLLSGLHSYA